MSWIDASVLLLLCVITLVAGVWASKRISEALDWLSDDDLGDAARLSDADLKAIRRELTSR
jgi:hypothetical protein